ncbi:MAG: hypothetical protein B6I38_01345 [Anaerolineaceae bacterium 4572_5.1]|nr:MAG: hypothetical protein B6I38_01345 [Anaerolineaceae bacterium 4572_5.1]
MNTFEIRIQHQPKDKDYFPIIVEHTRSDIQSPIETRGEFHYDQTLQRQLKKLAISPQEYGQALGEALFSGAIRDLFVEARSSGLRISLSVESPELKSLHWERLAAPLPNQKWGVLARNQNFPFSIHLASASGQTYPPIGKYDLKALILVANPTDLNDEHGLARFDDISIVQNMRTELEALIGAENINVLAAVDGADALPTVDNLLEFLTATHYPILHIVAHGQFIKSKSLSDTNLYLADADNRADVLSASRLIEQLQDIANLPRFAFLVTCESGDPRAEKGGSMGGFGQRLIRDLGMHAAVAMTDKISVTTAQALMPKFYERLREHGYPDQALVEAGAGLSKRRDIREFIVPVLFSRLRGRPLYSDAADRPPTELEIKNGIKRLSALLVERAPTLHDEFMSCAKKLWQNLSGTTPQARQERDEALRRIDDICYEALDFSFSDLARGQKASPYQTICPFPGLKAFGVPDGDEESDTRPYFFGRDALTADLQGILDRAPFLAVLGASGSGKSSLVMAGLVPSLQKEQPDLQIAYLRPGVAPTQSLKTALARLNPEHPIGSTLIIVDQFEELFTLPNKKERQSFLDALLALIIPPEGKEKATSPTPYSLLPTPKIVITMRTDFIGDCAPYERLTALIEQHTKLIPPMKPEELQEAITKQAEAVGLRFDPDLVNTIMGDAAAEPGAMPLLQHALQQLWKHRRGRWLRSSTYRELGGVQKAIASTADQVYRRLSLPEQKQVRQIFLRLTRVDEAYRQGEERRDTRRRVAFSKLVLSGYDSAATEGLVEKLATARLVVTGQNEITGEKEVEVTHEALIRHWPLLTAWIDKDRDMLRLRLDIESAARDWGAALNEDKADNLIHRGGRLKDIEAHLRTGLLKRNTGLLKLDKEELAYINACIALREQERREREAQERREQKALEQAAKAEAARKIEEKRRIRVAGRWASGSSVIIAITVSLAVLGFIFFTKAADNKANAAATAVKVTANAAVTAIQSTADAVIATVYAAQSIADVAKATADVAKVTAAAAVGDATAQAAAAAAQATADVAKATADAAKATATAATATETTATANATIAAEATATADAATIAAKATATAIENATATAKAIENAKATATSTATTDAATATATSTATTDAACAYNYFFNPAPKICPRNEATLSVVASQQFEKGGAIWISEFQSIEASTPKAVIFVLYDDGQWMLFNDTWTPDQQVSDPSIVPPLWLHQPQWGIGKIWRENTIVQEKLGWALAGEQRFTGIWQQQSVGTTTYLRTYDDRILELKGESEGDWEYVTKPTATLATSPTPNPSTPTPYPKATPAVPSDRGMIILQGTPDEAGLQTQVQWGDGNGNWNNVNNWRDALDETGRISWLVLPKDFNAGPFRWLVFNQDGSTQFVSKSFYLPDAGQSYLINY